MTRLTGQHIRSVPTVPWRKGSRSEVHFGGCAEVRFGTPIIGQTIWSWHCFRQSTRQYYPALTSQPSTLDPASTTTRRSTCGCDHAAFEGALPSETSPFLRRDNAEWLDGRDCIRSPEHCGPPIVLASPPETAHSHLLDLVDIDHSYRN